MHQTDYRDRTKRARQEPRPLSSRREQNEQPVPVAGKGTTGGDYRRLPGPVRAAGAVAQGTHVGRNQSDGGCVAIRGRCQPQVDDATPAERAQICVRGHGLHRLVAVHIRTRLRRRSRPTSEQPAVGFEYAVACVKSGEKFRWVTSVGSLLSLRALET